MPNRRPLVFIGSSSEGLPIAKALQVNLDRACEVVIWSQGVFGLSEGTLDALVNRADEFDFAILVLTPDDMVESRGAAGPAPRDNVLIELGLFIGKLGRKRTFVVYDREGDLKLPSDLAGVTLASYQPHSTGNLQSAVGASSTLIEGAVTELGLCPRVDLNFEIDQNTTFQIICDLLDDAARQFFILMDENHVALRRGRIFDSGLVYEYDRPRRSSGHGHFSVDQLCTRLADARLLQIDLRDQVTLTPRGHDFAAWLCERGYKAEYFQSALGGWGTKPTDSPPPG